MKKEQNITLGLIFAIILFYNSCKTDKIELCSTKNGLYKYSDFKIGTALNFNLKNTNYQYSYLLNSQFNSITPENELKFENIHPEKDEYQWREMDSIVNYCITNNKRIHGHTLIWHMQLPDWLINYNGYKSEWELIFKTHIQTIVNRYKGKINSWDVVNEAFNEDGTLRNTIWKEHIGNNYIEKAFIYAREADPNAKLFYNDFNLESNTTKRENVIKYFNQLKLKGIDVDGIGLQMHVNLNDPSTAQISEAFFDVTEFDYLLHLSELDISLNPLNKSNLDKQDLFKKQAEYLAQIVLNYKQIPNEKQFGITFWGISDNDSWIPNYYKRTDYPLLFDSNYEPKPSYCKLIQTL